MLLNTFEEARSFVRTALRASNCYSGECQWQALQGTVWEATCLWSQFQKAIQEDIQITRLSFRYLRRCFSSPLSANARIPPLWRKERFEFLAAVSGWRARGPNHSNPDKNLYFYDRYPAPVRHFNASKLISLEWRKPGDGREGSFEELQLDFQWVPKVARSTKVGGKIWTVCWWI